MLTDSFGRKFYYLRLSITDNCNFKCNYCLPDGADCNSGDNPLSLSEIETLVSAFAKLGTKKIRITGGEPALRKDLVEVIQTCAQTPGIEKVALTTNGFNLRKKAQAFKTAGLDSLNISADSLDPRMFEAITGKKMLNQILQGIDAAQEFGISSIKLNTVLLREYNLREFALFLDFVRHNPVSWRFIELMQTGDNLAFFKRNHVAGQNIERHLRQNGWQLTAKHPWSGPANEYHHSEYRGKIGLITPYSKDFCATCNRLRVSSQGKLHLCLFADNGFDIREQLQTGDVAATCEAIRNLLSNKIEGHHLHDGFTGATKQLAMLGG